MYFFKDWIDDIVSMTSHVGLVYSVQFTWNFSQLKYWHGCTAHYGDWAQSNCDRIPFEVTLNDLNIYFFTVPALFQGDGDKKREEARRDLGSRGLCLIPVESTIHVASSNGADFWSPAMGNNNNVSSSRRQWRKEKEHDQWDELPFSKFVLFWEMDLDSCVYEIGGIQDIWRWMVEKAK